MKKILLFIFILFQIQLIHNTCIKYYNFCIQCDNRRELCDYCIFPVFKPDLEGGCVGTKICMKDYNLCLECNQDSTLCQKCKEGYIPDNNGGCTLTKNCDVSYHGSCQTCLQNYSLVNDGQPYLECKKLPKEKDPYCKNYDDEGICNECLDNHFLTHGNKKCSNVNYCNIFQNEKCSECISGFYLDKNDLNSCKPYNDIFYYCKESEDGEKCSLCRDGFYLSQDNNCTITPHCLESKPNSYYCQKCEEDYHLTSEGSCSITEHCKIIQNPDEGKCYICEKNYYLNTKTGFCISNQEDNDFKNCEKGSDECESCVIYYHLGEDKKCSKSLNCLESLDGTCVKCSEDFFLTKNNKCIGTNHCIISDDYYRCEECEIGFFYNYTGNECVDDEEFEQKFKNCKNIDYIGENCFECRNNYYLNKTDNKCYLSEENDKLYKCAEIDFQNNCTKCEKNYYLGILDNKCTSIYGCYKSENADRCIQCGPDYCLTNGLCNYTSIIADNEKGYCYKCSETNENGIGCKTCLDGYSLSDDGLCINLDYCEEKENKECLKCKDDVYNEYGWHLSFCINKQLGCVENYNENCLRCDDIHDMDQCSECSEGYRVEEGECVACTEGCIKCSDDDNCLKCDNGYELVKIEEDQIICEKKY